jgi:hypothetical protein
LQRLLPSIACFVFLAGLAADASAGGPSGAAFGAGGPRVAAIGAGGPRVGFGLGKPVFGVNAAAPPAVAPSFRYTVPRTHIPGRGPVVVAGGLPYYVGPPLLVEPVVAEPQVVVPIPERVATPPAPPPPPEPEVIRYADGRYELRGDGIAVPYRWVWIPQPPPPPGAARDVKLYGWTDESGAIYVTDRLDKVPARFRAEAMRNASS